MSEEVHIPKPFMTAETEAYMPGSHRPVRPRIGHLDEGVKQLSPEEFKEASRKQKLLDAEFEAQAARKVDPRSTLRTVPKSASPDVRPSGKRSKAPRTTSAQIATPSPDPRISALETRISKIESGMEDGFKRVLSMMASQHGAHTEPTREEEVVHGTDLVGNTYTSGGEAELEALLGSDGLEDGPVESETEVRGGVVPLPESGDPAILRLQSYIQRKQPLKDFRRAWHSLAPRASFQEWPPTMQERFTRLFNTIIVHPKFLHQVRRTVATFRNGAVIGEEQMYRILLTLTGSVALYQIITEPS